MGASKSGSADTASTRDGRLARRRGPPVAGSVVLG